MVSTDPGSTPHAAEPTVLEVRRDESGRPQLSVTFLLVRSPAPHEPISGLVLSATVSVGLVSRLNDLVWMGFTLAVAEPVSGESHGPFGSAALATTLAGGEAQRLLTALAVGHGGPPLEFQARRRDGMSGQWLFDFAEVLAPAITPDPEAVVHLVTVEGGVVTDVPPARPVARSRGPGDPGVLMVRQEVATPIAQLVRPKPPKGPPGVDLVRIDTQAVAEKLIGIHLNPREVGPVLGSSPLLGDRGGTQRWYLPEVTLVTPTPGVTSERAPFRFDLATVGHQADGTPGLEATVLITLTAGPSAATMQAWSEAGQPTMKPLPCQVQVGLRIPLRDGQGVDRVETIAASTVEQTGTFGEQGSTVRATFRLANGWARLAYGALSTPGFQTSAPQVQITLSHEGWESRGGIIPPHLLPLVATPKMVALRRAGDPDRPLSKTQSLNLAKAKVQVIPAIASLGALKPGVIGWSWVRRTTTVEVAIIVPCAAHGALYQQSTEHGWVAIGCQPALQLGQAEYRTWQAETVSSVSGVRVFRSLTQPGRFLVVPERYDIGRHPADDPERALQPTLLLTSTIDVNNPANILCVLAAALEPRTSAAEYALLDAELRQRTGGEVELLSPGRAGLPAEVSWAVPQVHSLECLPVETGFTVVISTGVPGFLALKHLLQIGSVVGSARYRLPGGIDFASTLRLDLGNVVGPLMGAVEVTASDDRLTLVNRLERQVTVDRVIGNGAVAASPGVLLEPSARAAVARPAGSSGPWFADYGVAPGTETLDETRSYVEDLELGVTFIATGSFTDLAGLEVAGEFLGHHDEVFTLTEAQRSRERRFVLPLTAYATDPAVVFTVTAVTSDGTRTSSAPVIWPVRSQGVLIPLDRPGT